MGGHLWAAHRPRAVALRARGAYRERKAAAGDPERQAELWASRLERIERKRGSFQDMVAEGLITFDELREKLGALQGEHAQARRELDAVLGARRR